MVIQEIKLIRKIPLTHDVFELDYEFEKEISMIPGQFITFLLPEIGGRAYSILSINGNIVRLIIKRRKKEDGGRGGSMCLCDALTGDTFKAVGPAGHFTLKSTPLSKCFIGTGTGFVPLYNQILGCLENEKDIPLTMIFGVRNKSDLFYTKELKQLTQKYPNFSYTIHISREEIPGFKTGYVTDSIDRYIISGFQEFYICGMPQMIDSCVEKIISLGGNKDRIYFEKYL